MAGSRSIAPPVDCSPRSSDPVVAVGLSPAALPRTASASRVLTPPRRRRAAAASAPEPGARGGVCDARRIHRLHSPLSHRKVSARRVSDGSRITHPSTSRPECPLHPRIPHPLLGHSAAHTVRGLLLFGRRSRTCLRPTLVAGNPSYMLNDVSHVPRSSRARACLRVSPVARRRRTRRRRANGRPQRSTHRRLRLTPLMPSGRRGLRRRVSLDQTPPLAWHVLSRGTRTSTLVSMPDVFVPACLTPGTTGCSSCTTTRAAIRHRARTMRDSRCGCAPRPTFSTCRCSITSSSATRIATSASARPDLDALIADGVRASTPASLRRILWGPSGPSSLRFAPTSGLAGLTGPPGRLGSAFIDAAGRLSNERRAPMTERRSHPASR